jgi:mono/diheme cytochrome c family protein
MSAMPAWGKTLDDAAIWDLVAFLRQMPSMTPETYQQLSKRRSG